MNEQIRLAIENTMVVGDSEVFLHAVNADNGRGILMISHGGLDTLINIEAGEFVALPDTGDYLTVLEVRETHVSLLVSEGRMH